MNTDARFAELFSTLRSLPGVLVFSGEVHQRGWWVKFRIDISNLKAWEVVQRLAHVLNYLSIEERLPTSFHPVSPPPYLNGGPSEFLSWVIECHDPDFSPKEASSILEGVIHEPIDDPEADGDGDEGEDEALI